MVLAGASTQQATLVTIAWLAVPVVSPGADRRARRLRTTTLSKTDRTVLGYALFGAFWGAWGGVLPAIQRHAQADDDALGLALVMIGAGALATMRLTGFLIDRYGTTVLPLTGVAFGAAAFAPGLVSGPVALGISLALLGAAAGAMDVALSASGVAAEAETGRPLLNLGNAIFSGAVVVASLGAGIARGAEVSGGAVLGVVGGVTILVSVNLLGPAPGERLDEPPEPPATTPGRLLRRPPTPLLILGGLGMLAYLVENAWQSWGAVHLDTTLHATPATAAAAPAVFAACAAAGRLAGNRLLSRWTPAPMVTAGAAVAAGGTTLGALAPHPALALVGIGLAGLGTSVCAPTLISVAGGWAGRVKGIGVAGATSTVVTLSYLGFLIGPGLVGLVSGAATLPTALGVVAIVAAGLAVLAAPALRGVRHR